MSISPQTGGQRVVYVQLDHEPEVTQEVSRMHASIVFMSFITILGFRDR